MRTLDYFSRALLLHLLLLLLPLAARAEEAAPSEAAIADRVEALLAKMTLDEKVGQMVQPVKDVSPDDVKNFFIGSVLSGGGGALGATPTEWADAYDRFQKAALATRLQIPIIYGLDAVHGHNNALGAVMFPHHIGLGAAADPDLMKRMGEIVAEEVLTTGPNWTFAPCLAVPRNERWGRAFEGFGEDPRLVGLLGAPYVEGLQGPTLGGRRLVACLKHWVADGGTRDGQNAGNAILTDKELNEIHIAPYLPSIRAGAATVMVSFNSVNGGPCHIDKALITDKLKGELGFQGVVVSDWLGIGGRYVQAINAGIDMGMEPTTWRNFISAVKAGAMSGQIPQSRIDDAVRRILTVKFRSGLMDHPLADRELIEKKTFGSPAHRAVAREAVRKSLVLLKNEGALPISKSAKIFVTGKCADNIGFQCGGWTIGWLGGSGAITPGTSILAGLKEVAPTATIDHDATGAGAAGHDVALVVIGETPYAEGYGDRYDLRIDEADRTVLAKVLETGVPTVVVLVSGRPLIVTEELGKCRAFVAAWLPGTEGAGIADVLFGDHDFQGRLPHTWPASMKQIPINVGDASYDPLFPYGYGWNYKKGKSRPIRDERVTGIRFVPPREEIRGGQPLELGPIGFIPAVADGKATGKVLWRRKGAANLASVPLAPADNGGFKATLPAEATQDVFEYYVEISEEGQTPIQEPETPVVATPDVKPPAAVAELKAVEAKSYRATVAWQPATDDRGIAGYEVYRGKADRFELSDVSRLAKLPAAAGNFADDAPPAKSTAWYAVRAVDVVGREGEIAYLAVDVPDHEPPANKLTVKATPGSQSVVLNWTGDNEPIVSAFEIHRSDGPEAPFAKIGEVTDVRVSKFIDKEARHGTTYRYAVRPRSAAGLVAELGGIVTAAPLRYLKRINCGGPEIASDDGLPWEADAGQGHAMLASGGTKFSTIRGADPAKDIYQTERWANTGIRYVFPVDPGQYELVLHFSETNPAFGAKGKRLFDIVINDEKLGEKIDIFTEAGGVGKPWAFRQTLEVPGKELVIRLLANPVGPAIKGIEIRGLEAK